MSTGEALVSITENRFRGGMADRLVLNICAVNCDAVRKAFVEKVGTRHANQVLDRISEERCDHNRHRKPCTAKNYIFNQKNARIFYIVANVSYYQRIASMHPCQCTKLGTSRLRTKMLLTQSDGRNSIF